MRLHFPLVFSLLIIVLVVLDVLLNPLNWAGISRCLSYIETSPYMPPYLAAEYYNNIFYISVRHVGNKYYIYIPILDISFLWKGGKFKVEEETLEDNIAFWLVMCSIAKSPGNYSFTYWYFPYGWVGKTGMLAILKLDKEINIINNGTHFIFPLVNSSCRIELVSSKTVVLRC